MKEIKIYGTGGQGAVIAGKIFADAAAKGSFFVQSFSAYGAERRGGKVESFVRFSKEPVSIHCKMYAPDFVVMMDDIFVKDPANMSPDGKEEAILINSTLPAEHFNENGKRKIITIDAYKIAKDNEVLLPNGMPVINTTILGALAGMIPEIKIDDIESAIREGKIPVPDKNVAAAREAYMAVREGFRPGQSNDDVPVTPVSLAPTPVYVTKRPPCEIQCPAGHVISKTLELVRQEKFEDALLNIKKENPFPSITGRVCFHPCENACSAGKFMESISINAIERTVSDQGNESISVLEKLKRAHTGNRIAIVGSGPAGMSCAVYSLLLGHQVTIFEALAVPGGIPRVGIPAYRLPNEILEKEVNELKKLGVEIKTGTRIGQDLPFEQIQAEFDASFIGTGAHISRTMGVPGEDSAGVVSGLRYLKSISMDGDIETGSRVLVVGGGNTAFDAARSARRQGAESVTILYRRSQKEMPAYSEEIDAALTEEIDIITLAVPEEVVCEDDRVIGLKWCETQLGEPDADGRLKFEKVPGKIQMTPADMIITAIGELADYSFLSSTDLEIENGLIQTDIFGQTNIPGVFAGGDITNKSWTVPEAIGAGKRAAIGIDLYVNNKLEKIKDSQIDDSQTVSVSMASYLETGKSKISRKSIMYDELNLAYGVIQPRTNSENVAASDRLQSFKEINKGLTRKEAGKEAHRCFHCGTCNLCGNCYIFCPDMAITYDKKNRCLEVDQQKCKSCGICIQECPRGAIAWKGVEA